MIGSNSMSNTLNVFPTPIGVYELGVDLDLVKEVLDEYESAPFGVIEGSQSSYHLGSSVLHDPNLRFLKDKINASIEDYRKVTCLEPLVINLSWYNLMDIGRRVKLHRHEASVISGAFYVDLDGYSSPIRFKNPLLPYKMNELFENMNSEYANTGVVLTPKKSTLLLFPSWLEHETFPEDGKRCVISFNTFHKISIDNLIYTEK